MPGKRSKSDEQPREEFIDKESSSAEERTVKTPSTEQQKYSDWSLEKLQAEAQRRGIADSMQMDKKGLVEALKKHESLR